MTKPALKLEPAFRSGGEKVLAAQLEAAGLPVNHETRKLKYNVPAKDHTYTPDFPYGNIIIEYKGSFGRGPNKHSGDPVKERQKMLLVKAQHPELDIRFVFQRASAKIYKQKKGSKTVPPTHGEWATKNGFKWSDKSVIPAEWIEELKQQLED